MTLPYEARQLMQDTVSFAAPLALDFYGERSWSEPFAVQCRLEFGTNRTWTDEQEPEDISGRVIMDVTPAITTGHRLWVDGREKRIRQVTVERWEHGPHHQVVEFGG